MKAQVQKRKLLIVGGIAIALILICLISVVIFNLLSPGDNSVGTGEDEFVQTMQAQQEETGEDGELSSAEVEPSATPAPKYSGLTSAEADYLDALIPLWKEYKNSIAVVEQLGTELAADGALIDDTAWLAGAREKFVDYYTASENLYSISPPPQESTSLPELHTNVSTAAELGMGVSSALSKGILQKDQEQANAANSLAAQLPPTISAVEETIEKLTAGGSAPAQSVASPTLQVYVDAHNRYVEAANTLSQYMDEVYANPDLFSETDWRTEFDAAVMEYRESATGLQDLPQDDRLETYRLILAKLSDTALTFIGYLEQGIGGDEAAYDEAAYDKAYETAEALPDLNTAAHLTREVLTEND